MFLLVLGRTFWTMKLTLCLEMIKSITLNFTYFHFDTDKETPAD